MTSCLGVYLNDDIIKFAKLTSENGRNIKLEQYGVRFIKTSKKDALNTIIEETNSKGIPVVMNPQDINFIPVQIFDQAQSKSYIPDVMKMEYEAWCEKNAKSAEKYQYVYKVSELKNSENKHNGSLAILDKKVNDEIANVGITNMLPPQLLINRLVPEEDTNYLLVNLDDMLTVTTMINGKMFDFKSYNVGMQKILSEFQFKLGSYQKAYEACKQLNVFSEGETNNDRTLEIIIEPIFQEILKNVLSVLTLYRKDISKVILTGSGVLFTNIDILFREFLDIKCEILKPYFLQDTSDVRNMAEKLETTQAMTLAFEVLNPSPVNKNLECSKANNKIKNSVSGAFSFFKKKDNENVKTKDGEAKKTSSILGTTDIEIDTGKIFSIIVCVGIVAILTFGTYFAYSLIYSNEVDKMVADLNKQTSQLVSKTSEVDADVNYIRNNTNQYKQVTTNVDNIIKQIETSQIGKFTTYNVASFLQNIIKIIPKNVQLQTISSDDNKNIKITAKSNSYADLGYLVAELKLQGTLNNIKINNITNGENTVIEIGGELP